MRFSSLGSGSGGNALLVEADAGATCTRLLLDCGFSAREIERRLARRGVTLDSLAAVVVTHEHADHVGSALTLARKARIPLLASWGTARAIGADAADIELRVLWGDEAVEVGDLQLQPYTVPHDAREPLQYVFSDGNARLGVLTDVGCATPHIRSVLSGCDALVLECNHDRAMLAAGRYPAALKARIGGDRGHLANDAAAALLASLERSRLRHLVAAHLSDENNLPSLAQAALATVLGCAEDEIRVATQDDGFDWLVL